MPRVKRGVTARARHKKIFTLSKGYRMLIVPAATRSMCSAVCGSLVSTPAAAPTA